jgi:hypothetical protein
VGSGEGNTGGFSAATSGVDPVIGPGQEDKGLGLARVRFLFLQP